MSKERLWINDSLQEYNRIYKEINKLYHRVAQKLGVSDSAFDIFYTLCEYENGCTQKEICDITFLPKQTVHSTIQNLKKEGLVTLTPGKGRSIIISLSPLGKKVILSMMQPVFEAEGASFDSMATADTEQLLYLSNLYLEHLRQALAQI